MTNDSQLAALERLTKLRDGGAITEEEFATQKASILAGGGTNIPFYRRLWVVVVLTCLILTFWLALLILATGEVYRRAKDGSLLPIKKTNRYVYASLLGLWLVAVVVKAVIDPTTFSQNRVSESGANTEAAANDAGAPDACDSSDAADTVKAALEGSSNALQTVKVLDFGHAQETFYDKAKRKRGCKADAELSTGSGVITYQLYFGPSGKELVQVQQGDQAEMEIEVDGELKKQLAAKEAEQSTPSQTRSEPSPAIAPAPANNGQEQTAAASSPSDAAGQAMPKDPLDGRYTTTFKNCLATGDAANGVTSAMVDCTDKEIAVQDAKLNSTYQTTMAALNSGQQSALRDTQRAWIKSRDSKCDAENQTGGTIDQVGRPACVLEKTIERTMELEKMSGR